MKPHEDPFVPLAAAAAATGFPTEADPGAREFAALASRPLAAHGTGLPAPGQPAVGRLLGFDLLGQPLVGGIAALPGERVPARSTVPLRRAQVGQGVVLLFEGGDARAPLIMGVLEAQPLQEDGGAAVAPASVQVDGQRQVIQAESEVVLRCGDASITLTRAGKVVIKGHYILSRSSGANKIKGAFIDIN